MRTSMKSFSISPNGKPSSAVLDIRTVEHQFARVVFYSEAITRCGEIEEWQEKLVPHPRRDKQPFHHLFLIAEFLASLTPLIWIYFGIFAYIFHEFFLCQAYRTCPLFFSGQVKAPKWLELNWLLSLFGQSRRSAAKNYRDFVTKVDITNL